MSDGQGSRSAWNQEAARVLKAKLARRDVRQATLVERLTRTAADGDEADVGFGLIT